MTNQYRKPLAGTQLEYYDVRQAVEDIQPGAYETLPYTSKVLAEQLVRKADAANLTDYLKQLIERRQDMDFPWYPARVVCHDILGQTALVDLAGLRDAIADKGGDPSKVNPVVPTQLIVDHSLAVEYGGFDPDAFEKNRAVEDRRNEDRFHFIEWTKTAFKNVDVIPAGNGIMHQINLEKMSPVIQNRDGLAFPDTCVGTDSHTPHTDALGVISVGVGGLEAENVMLGRASWMRLPDIIGVELVGQRQAGITATDIVLALTEFLRKERVVGAYLEFFGEGADTMSIGDRATISNMTPEYGATAAMFYIDQNTIDYLRLTGREDAQVALVEQYAKEIGLWASDMTKAQYPRVLRFDLSTVTRNIAGPSNPHARVSTADLKAKGQSIIAGQDVFKLYDTYGFPVELTEEIAEEAGMTVDREGFEAAMKEQQERARASAVKGGSMGMQNETLQNITVESVFNYNASQLPSKLVAIVADNAEAEAVSEGTASLIFAETPFYAEMGGQVADHGQILDTAGNVVATVTDVQKAPNGQALHTVEVLAPLALNQEYTLAIDTNRRHRVMKNHTATHLLHAALHNILGNHATQAGSLNEVEFLRFDFTHFQAVTAEELRAIEQQVNEKIWEALEVKTVETDIDTAKEMGAMALFGEKYGKEVRVVTIGDYSVEL